MAILFYNLRNRGHSRLYGAGAFYDLSCVGRQAKMATNLAPGEDCIVAVRAQNGQIEFTWFSFSHERVMDMPDEPGTKIRVYFGERRRMECLPQASAIATEPYSHFFNVKGHFKRQSAIKA